MQENVSPQQKGIHMERIPSFRHKPLALSLLMLLTIHTTMLPRRHKSKKAMPQQKSAQQQQPRIQKIMTKEAYDALLASDKTVFIKFSADWCGACKILDPVFQQIAQEQGDKAVFASLDVDIPALSGVTQAFNIRGIPAVVAIKNNKMIDKKVGSCEKSGLVSFVTKNIQRHAKNQKDATLKNNASQKQQKETSQSQQNKKTSHNITTYDEFKKLQANTPYLVIKLEADWCGACSHFNPAFNAVASKYNDQATFASINTEKADEKLRTLIAPHKRRGIPAVMYIYNGDVVDTSVGSYPERAFESEVKKLLQKNKQDSQKANQQSAQKNNASQQKKQKEAAQKDNTKKQQAQKKNEQKKQSSQTSHAITTYDDLERLKANVPYLVVNIGADWCGPCKQFKPNFDAVAGRYSDKVAFASINTEKADDALLKFIAPHKKRGIPAIMYVYNGDVIDSGIGASERGLELKVQNLLQKTNQKSPQKPDQQQNK
jgi:thioredoxin 1